MGRDTLLGLSNPSRDSLLAQLPGQASPRFPALGRRPPSLSSSETRADALCPKTRQLKGKSQASNTACGFLEENHRRFSSGWQSPQSPLLEAWPGSTVAAKTYVGTRLHWQHLLVAISSPVQCQPLAVLAAVGGPVRGTPEGGAVVTTEADSFQLCPWQAPSMIQGHNFSSQTTSPSDGRGIAPSLRAHSLREDS